jgi:hypothetical protein
LIRRQHLSITTGYRLDGPSSIPGSARFIPSPQLPDRLSGPPSLLSNGHWGKSGRGMKLTTHFHLEPRLRKVELHLRSPIRLHGVVLKQLSIGTTLPFRLMIFGIVQTVKWLLTAGPVFKPRGVYVRVVLDERALEKVLFHFLRVSPENHHFLICAIGQYIITFLCLYF